MAFKNYALCTYYFCNQRKVDLKKLIGGTLMSDNGFWHQSKCVIGNFNFKQGGIGRGKSWGGVSRGIF